MPDATGPRRRAVGRDRSRGRTRHFERLMGDPAGAGAVEFAIVAPVLAILLLGGAEVFRLSWTIKKTTATANALGEMISSTQTSPTADDLGFTSNAGMLIAPHVLVDARNRGVLWSTILRASYASVVFKPTLPGCLVLCTYAANVAWSAGPQRRPCGKLQPAADDAPFSPTTLPQSVFGPASLVVVDVQYDYKPMFGSSVVGPRTIARSAYFVPRYVDPLTLGDTSANPSLATRCPGYT